MVNTNLQLVNSDPPDIVSWGFSQALVAARFVEWCLRDFGLRVPSDNRTTRAAEIVRVATQINWEDMSVECRQELSQATRTILEQYLIVRAINEPSDALKERLRWLLKGNVCPGRKGKTQPYDVQFELFAGATLMHAGIQGVRLEEPDWRLPAGDREVGVAAKRVSSRSNFSKLVRKAVSQIRGHSGSGVIVLNLDVLVATDGSSEASAQVTALVKEARKLVAALEAEDAVFCLFGFATSFQVLPSPDGGILSSELFTHGEVIEPDLSNASKITAWFGKLGSNIMRSVRRAMQDMPHSPA